MAIDNSTMETIKSIIAQELSKATSLLEATQAIAKGVTQYVGARYVPLFANPIHWDNTREYEPLTIVLYQGNSYTTRQFTPAGIDINNDAFWVETGNYNAQVEQYRQEVINYKNDVDVLTGIVNKCIKTYNSFNEMLDDINKISGIYATLSYYDGKNMGGAFYKVTINELSNKENYFDEIIQNDNKYIHHVLIHNGYVNALSIGALNDGMFNNTEVVNNAFNNYNGQIYFPAGIYLGTSFKVTPGLVMDTHAIFTCSPNSTDETFITLTCFGESNKYLFRGSNTIIRADANNNQNVKTVITGGSALANIHINAYACNFYHTGVRLDSVGSSNEENSWNIYAIASENSTQALGVMVDNYDNDCGTIITIDCECGVQLENGFFNCDIIHSWFYKKPISTRRGTRVIDLNSIKANIGQVYCDGASLVINDITTRVGVTDRCINIGCLTNITPSEARIAYN